MAAPASGDILAFGGPDHQNDLDNLRWVTLDSNCNSIETVNSKWRYGIAPGLAGGTQIYGWQVSLAPSNPDRTGIVLIPFQFRYEAAYDAAISVMELVVPGTTDGFARRLNMPTNQRFQIVDGDEALIDQGSANDLSANTEYDCLWLVDMVNGFDRLWVDGSLVLEKDGHGNVGAGLVTAVEMGTAIGKGLPTGGDKFFICNIAVQAAPTAANGIGSADAILKMPSGAGDDNDFDADGSPSYLNVDEIPADNVATDIGDAVGEQQSYAAANVDGGDIPLAFQVDGAARMVGGSGTLTYKPYIKTTSGDRAYGNTTSASTSYLGVSRQLDGDTFITLPNGDPITEAGANALEVGVEIVAISSNRTLELDQIGLSYVIEGARSLPSDFPVPAGSTVTPTGAIFY